MNEEREKKNEFLVPLPAEANSERDIFVDKTQAGPGQHPVQEPLSHRQPEQELETGPAAWAWPSLLICITEKQWLLLY